jgi:hypothetical protein
VEVSFARFRSVQSLTILMALLLHQIPFECTQIITKVDGNQPSIVDTTLPLSFREEKEGLVETEYGQLKSLDGCL